MEKNITLLKDKEQELDKAIERLSNEEEIDVDDAVTTTAPLYKQSVISGLKICVTCFFLGC